MRTTEFKNPVRVGLITELKKAAKKEDAGVWETIASLLSQSRSRRPEINIQKINNYSSDGDTVVVPGKVLGVGKLDHKVVVAAFGFTEGARKEIEGAGGRVLSIMELVKENSKGSGVKIIG